MDWPEATIVVVDDGSTDATWSHLETLRDVVTIRGDGSLWWSGCVNAGARRAINDGADVVLLWNDDNIDASENLVSELAVMASSEECCVCPVVVYPSDGDMLIASAGGETAWLAGAIRLRQRGEIYRPSTRIDASAWLPGQSLAISASVFESLGGFDAARFPQYRGDSDFTLRASQSGIPCHVLWSAWVANDIQRTGHAFYGRVSVRRFFSGLVSRRSNYELRSTIAFYWRHAPRHLFVWSLCLFYAKYVYATLKTWFRPTGVRVG